MKNINLSEKKHLCMKDLPQTERPYERCKEYGPGSLTNAELLAVILKNGSAKNRVTQVARKLLDLCESYGGIYNLSKIPYADLLAIDGIGEIKAITLQCVGELAERIRQQRPVRTCSRIESPQMAADYFMNELGRLDIEEAWILMVDGRNCVIRKEMMTKGTANSSIMPVREILKQALRYGAVGLFIIHNHPSGDVSPSIEDKQVTLQMKSAARLVGIDLIDHVIVSEIEYYSFKEHKML